MTISSGGRNDPAGTTPTPASRPGHTCWLCGQPVTDPPRITGQIRAGQALIAHRACMQVLGALDLNLPFPTRP